MSGSANTPQSFKDKWEHNPTLAFAETLNESSEIFRWILRRNGFGDASQLRAFLQTKRRVLDAGCGNGRVTALLRKYSSPEMTEIIGVDLVAADIARENLRGQRNLSFCRQDLLADLSHLGRFDFVYCQEVLHHTGDPRRAFMNLCNLLTAEGEIAIYVYREKAPAREFVDDYVRERISRLNYADAMAACRQITELGRALSEAKITIEVPAVPLLAIEAGSYDVQRFLYHFFVKCFWNPGLSFEENVAINYDWYHPQLATRHTLPEVEGWFRDAGLEIVHSCVDHYGITARGKRC